MRHLTIAVLSCFLWGCGTVRVHVPAEDKSERLTVKCSAPSKIVWEWGGGGERFERTGSKPLPPSVKCVPPDVFVLIESPAP
jgi:hypothetical protein